MRNALVDARRSSGLTQRQLAERAHTSPSAISCYEKGRRVLMVSTVIRLAEAYGLKPQIEVMSRVTAKADEQRLAAGRSERPCPLRAPDQDFA